jgi:hypothetical protein
MADRPELSDFERALAATLKAPDPMPSPDCLDPDQIIDLAEGHGRDATALRQLGHVAGCAYCRDVFQETRQILMLSQAAGHTEHDDLSKRPPFEHSNSALFGPSGHSYDWTALSASSSLPSASLEFAAFGGTVKLTLWLDGDELVLTADNDPRGLWDQTGPTARFTPGEGVDFSGELLHYEIAADEMALSGYLVLPSNVAQAAAEVGLGEFREMPKGELLCRIATADELTDADVALASLHRGRDRATRQAWVEWSRAAGDRLSAELRDAIERETRGSDGDESGSP